MSGHDKLFSSFLSPLVTVQSVSPGGTIGEIEPTLPPTFEIPLDDMIFYSKAEDAASFTAPEKGTGYPEIVPGLFITGKFNNGVNKGEYELDVSGLSAEYADLFPGGASNRGSISFWIKPDSHSDHTTLDIVPTNTASGEWSFKIYFNSGFLAIDDTVEGSHVNHSGNTTLDLVTHFPIGVYTHFTWTDVGRLYVNGVLKEDYGTNGTGSLDTVGTHNITITAPTEQQLGINYTTSGTDKNLTSPSDNSNTINTNFIPCTDINTTIFLFIGDLSWQTSGFVGNTTDWVGQNSSTPTEIYGPISFRPEASFNMTNFAVTGTNGLKTMELPRPANNDILGGSFNYFYHSVAWTTAFNGNNADIVIAQSGSVYKTSISPSNLVVTFTGVVGPAGGGSGVDIVTIISIDDFIIWKKGQPNFTNLLKEGFAETVPAPPPPSPSPGTVVFHSKAGSNAEWDTPEIGAAPTRVGTIAYVAGQAGFGNASVGQAAIAVQIDMSAYVVDTTEMSVGIFLKPNAAFFSGDAFVMALGGQNTGFSQILMLKSGSNFFVQYSVAGVGTPYNFSFSPGIHFTQDVWTHIGLTMRSAGLDAGGSANRFRTIIDGVQVDSSNQTYTPTAFKVADTTGHLGGGVNINIQFMKGLYDNPKIYNTETNFSGFALE